jgi:hypothetical protein
MSKIRKTNISKIRYFLNKYDREFILGPQNSLYCNICCCEINFRKKDVVEKHRLTKKHKEGSGRLQINTNLDQNFLTDTNPEFTNLVVKAFLSADIPLSKMDNKYLKNLFKFMNFPLPSERNARRQVEVESEKILNQIYAIISGKKIFLVLDESQIRSVKYFNIMVGLIENPKTIYCLNSVSLDGNVNSLFVVQSIVQTANKFHISFANIAMIISDAASYMIKAGKELKEYKSDMIHVTCLAHLIHNCAMNIRMHYQNIDILIARVRSLTYKNKSHQALFSTASPIPSVIITRWSSWLRAALFYADNLLVIKAIILNMEDEGIIVSRAKTAISDPTLYSD